MGIRSHRRGHGGWSLRAVARWLAAAAVAALVGGTGVLVGVSRGDWAVPAYAAPSVMPDNGYSSLLTNADGHLEAFVTAQNGVIYHSWQGVFGTWFGLAGPTPMQGSPVAGLNADGRGEAFAIGTNGVLMHTWQPSWPGWNAVHAQPGLAFVGQPALSLNDDGRLEVFARSSSGLYWHSWQLTPNGSWSDWYVMGAGVFSSDPVVIKNADGREEIFGVAAASPVWGALLPAPVPTGTVVHQWQSSPNGGWSPYGTLGGQAQGKVSVVRGPDGRLELFALDIFGSMGHIWQQTAGVGWSSVWGDLGAYFWTI